MRAANDIFSDLHIYPFHAVLSSHSMDGNSCQPIWGEVSFLPPHLSPPLVYKQSVTKTPKMSHFAILTIAKVSQKLAGYPTRYPSHHSSYIKVTNMT